MKWCKLNEKGKKQHKNGTQRLKKSFVGNQRAQVFEQLFTPVHKATQGKKAQTREKMTLNKTGRNKAEKFRI